MAAIPALATEAARLLRTDPANAAADPATEALARTAAMLLHVDGGEAARSDLPTGASKLPSTAGDTPPPARPSWLRRLFGAR